MEDLLVLRMCALLHDVGKPECWANRKPWSYHIYFTEELLAEVLGKELSLTAARHHSTPYYEQSYHPKTEMEKVICIADNIASGADRPKGEEVRRGGPLPKPPVALSHVLSDGSKWVHRTAARELAIFKEEFKHEFQYRKISEETYNQIFDFLVNSISCRVPADTRTPYNDVSLWDHLRLTSAIANCMWREGGYRGNDPSNYEFALLSGDADRVSSYVNRSSRLPDLKAGSARVKKATEGGAGIIRRELGPECLIFVGGGSFLALSPPKAAKGILDEVKEKFEETADGEVTVTVNHVFADGSKMQRVFGEVWKEAVHGLRVMKASRGAPTVSEVEESIQVCDVCGVRPAEYSDPTKLLPIDASPRYETLCKACWNRRLEGVSLKGVSLDDLGKASNNFVAVVRADGDDLGEILGGKKIKEFNKSVTPSRLSTISRLVHEICEKDLREIVEANGGECIFAGGDDVLAVLPGDRALETVRVLASSFDEKMGGEASLSAGVAIFHYKLPIYVGLEVSAHLILRAKENTGKASVAFDIVGGTGITRGEVERRPYRWKELDELLQLVNYLQKEELPRSQIRMIAATAKKKGVEYAQDLVKYQMGRGNIEWETGEKLFGYLESGLFLDAFLIYNAFRQRVYEVVG
ncbi:MAG: type III-B CRISPR-associated protein Cas10/Cmr2 [Candidatus Bathyarchaeia archaeon]